MKNVIFGVAACAAIAIPAYAAESSVQSQVADMPHSMAVIQQVDGNDLAVDELLKIAFNEDESLRIAAVQVMGDMGTGHARAALGIVLYGNSMGTVRAAAADQLGNLGDGESVFALALALETERDDEVRDVINANVAKSLPSENTERKVAVSR